MKTAALAFLFGFIGAAVGDEEGILPGILFGVLLGMLLGDRSRLSQLERELKDARRDLELLTQELLTLASRVAAPGAGGPEPRTHASEALLPTEELATQEAPEHAPPPPVDLAVKAAPGLPAAQGAPPDPPEHAPPPPIDLAVKAAPERPAAQGALPDPSPHTSTSPWLEQRLRALLFGGNTIVRAGILVLLVGVVLLLRWAAEHAVVPIELRMTGAALLAIGLSVVGYTQRELRPGFGRSLQGGGIAALYLVVFFAYRSYALLPTSAAFALLAIIALSSGVLAVLQDAMALSVIGQIGGFMAPVVASSGEGSHVALFSYYLLLNLLIFAVAWFKPWRALNLIGFVFTFGVGSSWGALRYRPELLPSTEPFLVAFFLLYSLIPVLYALRRPDERRGLVDGSLVFGTPLAVLLLQYQLVKDVRFGMAFSALGLAAFYVLLGRILHKRAGAALGRLVESFLAIGIGFATLAVPYGFDNHDFTGATWALEGAGLYWVGTRQKRWLSRLSGASLQVFSALALLVERGAHADADAWPIANAQFLASLLLCLGCLFVAQHAYQKRAQLFRFEANALQPLIALGLVFYLWAGLDEIDAHISAWLHPGLKLAFVAASLLALSQAARRFAWPFGRYPAALLALLLPLLLLDWEFNENVHPFGRGGFVGFPLCVALGAELLASFQTQKPQNKLALHIAFVWSCTLLAALEAKHLVHDAAHLNTTWSTSAVAAVLALALEWVRRGAQAARFPFRDMPDTQLRLGGGSLALAALFWSLSMNLTLSGDASPLAYWPLLNPLDLAQLLLFVAYYAWGAALVSRAAAPPLRAPLFGALGALAFLWFNGLLARSVHHLASVPFEARALWSASELQMALTVAWSVLGLCATVLGSTRKLRWLWILGALLLAVVVAKLFLLDLSQLSTLAKIITFLVAGMLLVLVGYFAPVPPSIERQPTAEPSA